MREAALSSERGIGVSSRAGVAGPVAAVRWELRWQGWADWTLTVPVLVLAAAAVAIDVATAWADVGLGSLGRVAVSPALPLVLVMAVLLGRARRPLNTGSSRAWREFGLGVGVVLGIAALGYGVLLSRPVESVGLLVAALGEELVFRLAAVLVLGAICARLLHRDWRTPRHWGSTPGFVGIAAAAVIFSVLPGHVAQMTTITRSVSFASLGLLLGYTVLRTGAVWLAIMVHALIDVMTLAAWQGSGLALVRLATAAGALLALVAATEVAGRRLGLRTRVPTLIDLRGAPRPA